jgi:hypothetical protein
VLVAGAGGLLAGEGGAGRVLAAANPSRGTSDRVGSGARISQAARPTLTGWEK